MAGSLASGAIAQAATRHRVNETARLAGVFASATYPNPESGAVNAGTISGKPAGGAVVQRLIEAATPIEQLQRELRP